MALILVSTFFSLILLGLVGGLWWPRQVGAACAISATATCLSITCLFSAAFGCQAFLTLVFGLFCAILGGSPRAMAWGARGAMAVSYGIFLWYGVQEVREVAQLRERYPLESLADRLQYEKESRPRTNAPSTTPGSAEGPVPLGAEAETRLAQQEKNIEFGTNRQYTLSGIHDRTRAEFMMARGFGPVRMQRLSIDRIEDPSEAPVRLPAEPSAEPYPHDSASAEVEASLAHADVPERDELIALHDAGAADFLKQDRMGYIESREAVAGFQSHQFSAVPAFERSATESNSEWRIVRIDLVSLLRHDEPVAYVTENLPKMEDLRALDAPTRPLDDFERAALSQLRAEKDLVTDDAQDASPDRVRMLGSLRAASSCLRCHSVPRGELLGAFSYELVPAKGPTRTRPAPASERPL
jgi:hypothetical protein